MFFRQQGDGVTAELRATRTTDPAVELRKAIAKNDLRFLGVEGYSIIVPGVPGEGLNPIVSIRDVRVIEGTSDAIQSTEHGQLQRHAYKYAMQYNHLLFAHLLRTNDRAVAQARSKIDKELLRMEHGDPIRDAKKAIQRGAPLHFIHLPEVGKTEMLPLSLPGIDRKTLEGAQRANMAGGVFTYEIWPMLFVAEMMTPMQRQQLALQVDRYVVPYNRYLFAYIQPFLAKERERLHKLMPRRFR